MKCPKCRYVFRAMADEEDGQHECPRCGYDGHEPEDDDDDNHESED